MGIKQLSTKQSVVRPTSSNLVPSARKTRCMMNSWHEDVKKSILAGERVVVGGIRCGRASFAREMAAMGFVATLEYKDMIVGQDYDWLLRRFYDVKK